MARQNAALSYQARREVLVRIAPRYQQASVIHKSLLLEAFVELTGYIRKSAAFLLNHASESKPIRWRSPLVCLASLPTLTKRQVPDLWFPSLIYCNIPLFHAFPSLPIQHRSVLMKNEAIVLHTIASFSIHTLDFIK